MIDKVPKKKIVWLWCSVFSLGFLDPWSWDLYVVPKRRCWITTLCCIISQKSADLTLFSDAGLGLAPHGWVQSD